MKIGAISIILLLFTIPLFTAGTPMDKFQGGDAEAVADLTGPGHFSIVNVTLPAECNILNATMNITGIAEEGVYPMVPEVLLNKSVLWSFNGSGYGALGMQDRFSNWENQTKIQIGSGGGTGKTAILLPKGALVQNATVETRINGPNNLTELARFTSSTAGYNFGCSVSTAGDVNGDGFDDVIVGAMGLNAGDQDAGHAYIYFGGPSINSTPDVTLTGAAPGDNFGCSVSNAGDVNKDGYDDVIVGAYADSEGGSFEGRAYIYFGSRAMDGTADVTLAGDAAGDNFGCSVSGAGDVNKDGYDDVIVGARDNDAGGNYSGSAYIYYGSHSMDEIADMTLIGAAGGDSFGSCVSNAGDVNGDGYDDVIIGAHGNDTGGDAAGRAYIYFGSSYMDNTPDVTFTGAAADNWFGLHVSAAGDVNNDGYDDVIVDAPFNNDSGGHDGSAYIFFGGASMDNFPDVTLIGAPGSLKWPWSVSNAGDVNKDGYDDVVVNALGGPPNHAYIYFGGPSMDNTSDVTLSGPDRGDDFGQSVSCAGDVNGDGYDDVIVGAPFDKNHLAHAYIFSWLNGTMIPNILIDSDSIWNQIGCFNGTGITSDFSNVLNFYLSSASHLYDDRHGNYFVDIPINVTTRSEGNITLFNLSIYYQYIATVPDFAIPLNEYILAHKSEKDVNGNITVPIIVRSHSAGKLKLFDLNITYNRPPRFTSTPVTIARAGVKYKYDAKAVDDDNDSLRFSLMNWSQGMSIDPTIGRINWKPAAAQKGNHTVTVVINDGRGGVAHQTFTIKVGSMERSRSSTDKSLWYLPVAVVIILCIIIIFLIRWKKKR